MHVHYAVPHAASAYLARQVLGAAAPRVVTTLHGTDVTRLGSDPSYRAITRFAVARVGRRSPCRREFLRREAARAARRSPARADRGDPELRRHRALRARRDARPRALRRAVRRRRRRPATAGPVLFHVSNFRAGEARRRPDRGAGARAPRVPGAPGAGRRRPRARRGRGSARASSASPRSVCFLGKRADFVELPPARRRLPPAERERELRRRRARGAELRRAGVRLPRRRPARGGRPTTSGRLVAPFDVDALAARGRSRSSRDAGAPRRAGPRRARARARALPARAARSIATRRYFRARARRERPGGRR